MEGRKGPFAVVSKCVFCNGQTKTDNRFKIVYEGFLKWSDQIIKTLWLSSLIKVYHRSFTTLG